MNDDHDPELHEHRTRVLEALSRHSDPIMREIGQQLANGAVSPHGLLREPQYVEALLRQLNQLGDLDDRQLRAHLSGDAGDCSGGGVPAGRR